MRSGFFLLSAVFFLILASCSDQSLWGLSRDELFRALETRDYGFLDSVDPSLYEKALAFGDEVPWCLALHFVRGGRIEEARAMLELGAQKSPEPFKSLCADELVRTGTSEQRLSSITSLLGSGPDLALENLRTAILLELDRYDEVFGPDPLIVAIRTDVYRKSWREAWTKAKPVLADEATAAAGTGAGATGFASRSVLSDFGKAALYGAANPAEEAPFFDRLADVAERAGNREAQYLFTFYAGRLYGSDPEKAAGRFASAMRLSQTDSDHDNALWYLFDACLTQGANPFLDAFAQYSAEMKNAGYFDDILETFIVRQVQDNDLNALMKLRDLLPASSDRDIQARLDYLAARSGLYDSAATDSAYRAAFEADHSSLYYRVLAAEALGINPESGERLVSGQKRAKAAAETDSAKARVLRALVMYHLEDYVYRIAVKAYPDCPGALARELAAALTAKGLYADAIRIVLLSIRASEAPIATEDLEYIYPRPWREEVAAAAGRFGIPEYVLYAMIRSESYFQNDAVSGAGAHGLTQLMAPTAADIARKLKLDSFDLADPATNITFGAYYLSELAGRLDGDMMGALYAYNAGITRVRSWIKDAAARNSGPGGSAGGRGGDLFLEGLPYSETREYGRKVLAAASVYGYLYYQKTTGQVVRELF